MKHILLYILFIGVLSLAIQPAKAAFFVKKNSTVASVANPVSDISQIATVETKKAESISGSKSLKELVSPEFRGMAYRGWFGKFSLLLGVLGFFNPLFAIGAVLFGFMGLNRRNRDTGIAIAGFVLGLTVLVLTIFFAWTPLALF